MNIFYFSVHQILEDDEIRLFKSLGHNVFCLGANGRDGSIQGFRPSIEFSAIEKAFYDDFRDLGGKFQFGNIDTIVLPPSFVEKFDLFIVMHDVKFIFKFWNIMCSKQVVWRTIGQGVEAYETQIEPYRQAGLMIVRYSPIEEEYVHSLGQDAVIRFYKDSSVYRGWVGNEESLITFSNTFKQRYPQDYEDYQNIVFGLPSCLGGIGNDESENALGLVESSEQISLLQRSRAYLYASGLYIPYTLNFMEAWMVGIPVIVYAPFDRKDKYFEIDRLVEDGVTGFICRDVASARARAIELLSDHSLATKIGSSGRKAAIGHFGDEVIRLKWSCFFDAISSRTAGRPVRNFEPVQEVTPVKNVSLEVFDALALLTPFDIDVQKMRFGNSRDGGYVLADIRSDANVISFGVGPDVTFELDMAERGKKVYLHDHTVDGTPQSHHRFLFSKKGVCGSGQENSDLFPLDKHMALIGDGTEKFILKMDVEGHEWDVFSTIDLAVLERFEQITLEVHWLENLVDTHFRQKMVTALSKINKHFTLFHVHGNNCAELHIVEGFTVASVLELSYVRTSMVRRGPSTQIYPSALDLANHPSFHDHALLFYPFIPSSGSVPDFRAMVNRLDMEKRLGI